MKNGNRILSRYRIRLLSEKDDRWALEVRRWVFWWRTVAVGSKSEVLKWKDGLEWYHLLK